MPVGQSKRHSFIEAIINVVVGYGIATVACWTILPFFGAPISMAASMGFGAVMTVISIARSYLLRRAFNWWHLKQHLLKEQS
jgi:hypothetical protein